MAKEKKATTITREIDGAVTYQGRVYTRGDEKALARALPPDEREPFIKSGQLLGDWDGESALEPRAAEAAASDRDAPTKPPKKTARKRAPRRER